MVSTAEEKISRAAQILKSSRHVLAFTGAGISVESGIPPFRGPGGLYERVSPTIFDINYFLDEPEACWKLLIEHVLWPLLSAEPNPAHLVLARLEKAGIIKAVITQNIDALHKKAGSEKVIEFHGTADLMECLRCHTYFPPEKILPESFLTLTEKIRQKKSAAPAEEIKAFFETFQVPRCPKCRGLIKPAIVFFGERIPEQALSESFQQANQADCLLIVGTSGVVYPAAMIPQIARANQAQIIEINTEPSEYTDSLSSIFIQSPASVALMAMERAISLGGQPREKS
ncbi:MAG: NAD-dependent deacylase [Candidatus Aminicenantes bacterium]|nr:NAD-dependent deacylase [Candidatus Aminicenantes bacterium]